MSLLRLIVRNKREESKAMEVRSSSVCPTAECADGVEESTSLTI
jgi:hypothetical protein